MPVHIVQEDVIALVATAHQVIHGAGILDSHFARHDAKGLAKPNQKVKPESKIYGLTPSMPIHSQRQLLFAELGTMFELCHYHQAHPC